jgi:hypothetical protein
VRNLQLISAPATRRAVEIGAKFGRRAFWFADMLAAHRVDEGRAISVDVEQFVDRTWSYPVFTDTCLIRLRR